MSLDAVFALLIAIAILATFVDHLCYFVGAVYQRRWQSVAKIGGSFVLYLLVIVVSFLLAVGLCAAGCPSGLNFLLGLFYLALSVGSVILLHSSIAT